MVGLGQTLAPMPWYSEGAEAIKGDVYRYLATRGAVPELRKGQGLGIQIDVAKLAGYEAQGR